MFSTTITLRDAMKMVSEIINRFGEGHIPGGPDGSAGCIYATSKNGALVPVCIVGQVFSDLGILRAVLQSGFVGNGNNPEQYAACLFNSDMWANAATMGVVFEDDAKTFLRYVQQAQDDNAETWNQTVRPESRAWGDAFRYGIAKMVDDAEKASQAHRLAKEYANWTPVEAWERELLNA